MSPRLDRLWYTIDAETKGFEEGVVTAGDKLKKFTDYAEEHPLTVLGALSAALIAAGYAAAQMAQGFEKEMKLVETTLGDGVSAMGVFGDGVKRIFTDIPVESLHELTRGLYDLTSSGIDAHNALADLEVAAKAAIAGASSTATAVDALTTVLNAYKATGIDATTASDQMFMAVNKGKVTFEQLASSMGTVTGMAASLGVPLKDILAITSQLTLNGINAAEAMTGIRSAIQQIMNPSTEFIRQFPQLAHEFTRVKLQSEGLVQFLVDFQRESKGSSVALNAMIRDVQGYNAVSNVMKDGGVALTQMLHDVENSAGATDRAYQTMADSSAALEQKLKNELHKEFLDFGQSVLPLYNRGLSIALETMHAITDTMDHATAAAKAYHATLVELIDRTKGGVSTDVGTRQTAQDRALLDAATRAGYAYESEGRAIFDGLSGSQLDQLRDGLASIAKADPSAATDRFKAFADAVRDAATAAHQAEAADPASLASRAADVAALRKEGDELAHNVQTYKALGDTQQVAAARRKLALDDVRQAQAALAQAETDAAAAAKAGDADALARAESAAKNARSTIMQADGVNRETLATLAQTAQTISSMKKEIADATNQLSETTTPATPLETAENRITYFKERLTQLGQDLAGYQASFDRMLAVAAAATRRQAQQLAQEINGDLAKATEGAFAQALRENADHVAALQDRINNTKALTQAEREQLTAVVALIDTDGKRHAQIVALNTQTTKLITGLQSSDHTPTMRDADALVAQLVRLRMQQAGLAEDSKDYQDIQAQINAILKERERIMAILQNGGKPPLADDAAAAQQLSQRVRDTARGMQELLQGALQLLTASGAIDQGFAGVLGSVGAIATQIPVFLDEWSKLGKLDDKGNSLASLGSVIGAAMPIVGGIASVISAFVGADQQARELQRQTNDTLAENTAAVKHLSEHIGDLSKSSLSGKELQKISAALDGVAANLHQHLGVAAEQMLGTTLENTTVKNLDRDQFAALAAQGITRSQIEELARTFNITLNDTAAAWEQLADALHKADLAAYVDTLAGRLNELQDSFTVYGITDPAEKLKRTLATYTDQKTGIPAIINALSGIDVSTQAGAQQAITALQTLFEKLAAGDLTTADLGGASVDQMRQAILDLIQSLRDGSGGQVGSYSIDRTITEATGSHLAGLLATGNVYALRTANAVEAIAAAMRGSSAGLLPSIAPPATASFSTGAGAVISGGLTVQVVLPPGTPAPTTLAGAEAIGSAAASAVDRALGTALRRRRRAFGSPVLDVT